MNENLEIEGDMREDVRAELEREEGWQACEPEPWTDESVNEYADEYAEREDMDGDHETALRDAGFGTDEDYGYFGGEDDFLDGSYEE